MTLKEFTLRNSRLYRAYIAVKVVVIALIPEFIATIGLYVVWNDFILPMEAGFTEMTLLVAFALVMFISQMKNAWERSKVQ